MTATRECTAALSRNMKSLSAVLPKKNRMHSIADVTQFSYAPPVDPVFFLSLIISIIRLSLMSAGVPLLFRDGPHGDPISFVLEGISHSLWLMCGILSQVKQDGFNSPEPALFNTNISFFFPASLSSQAWSAAALTDFLQSKRRESYVAHTTLPLSQAQKRGLLVSPVSASDLFGHGLLVKISSQVKEDSFLSSSLSMAMMAQSCTFDGGRSSSSSTADSSSRAGPSGYQFPLFQHSASNKSSTSPGRGGGSKRFTGGRGRPPSSESRLGFRFRKWGSYSCPALTDGCLSLHWQAWRDRGAEPWVVEVPRFGYHLPFRRVPPLSMEPIPHGFLFPNFHRGDGSGGCNSLSCRERGSRTSSSSFSGLLQPDVHRSEDLRVVESSGRPLGLQSLRFQD